jgi:hypothetical protein
VKEAAAEKFCCTEILHTLKVILTSSEGAIFLNTEKQGNSSSFIWNKFRRRNQNKVTALSCKYYTILEVALATSSWLYSCPFLQTAGLDKSVSAIRQFPESY